LWYGEFGWSLSAHSLKVKAGSPVAGAAALRLINKGASVPLA
jgi:hypothetical protein